MDEATLDRLAEAAWDLRCQRMAEAEDGPKFIADTWARRPEYLKETDRSVVSFVAAEAVADAGLTNERMRVQLMAFAAERDRTIRALERRADRAVPGVERDAWLAAAEVARGGGTQERSEEGTGNA